MGNISSANDEDFSKTIDFCKQLRLLHFVVNEPKTYSETYSQFQACIEGGDEADEVGTLKSQHKELARRIGEIDFDEYRLMFSIRRILFSAPFRGSIIGYDLVPVDVDSKSRRVKYVISFDTHEHRPPSSSSAPSPCPNENETGGASGGIKSYRTKRSYNEFVQLDERIRNLFSTAKERQDKRQLEEELDRRDRFMRQLEKSGSSSTSTSATSTKEDASSVEGRRPSVEEVQLEDDFWIYVKPKHLPKKRSSKEMSVEEEREDKGKEKDEDKAEEEEEKEEGDGYDGLKLPPLPPKQFCWDDASRLAVAETRMPLLEAYLQAVFGTHHHHHHHHHHQALHRSCKADLLLLLHHLRVTMARCSERLSDQPRGLPALPVLAGLVRGRHRGRRRERRGRRRRTAEEEEDQRGRGRGRRRGRADPEDAAAQRLRGRRHRRRLRDVGGEIVDSCRHTRPPGRRQGAPGQPSAAEAERRAGDHR